MKALVIAEKPSVARDIARVLHCQKQLNGALEGNEYIVTWALGHLVTLADPEAYDKKYAQWKMEDLPMIPKEMELVVIKQTAKQYGAVKAQLFRQMWVPLSLPRMREEKESWWLDGFWRNPGAKSLSNGCGFLL